ncbi:JAB domain-containing protein [Clostridioides sp. ZZV14-6150]|uniref:JAB domain-containing protein n=1 Tax=unclassified Clostridioides TaxID=2635829 RepID=UPI001D12E80E|nr:hypothetical protein [Clostridioides sp. ZZV14-6150]MCC0721647.1 hypothetical protein [Clostridioides sp. ZZV14-6104]MCC0733517.1 hypothetical protein [Clostridioides sp. ZZV14-6009]MCC0750170.1 hypothetical protein [Clostridioides sp. ZZV13-5731]
MNIRKYVLELNDERLPTMVCEDSYDYEKATALNSPAVIAEMLETCFRLKHKVEEHVVVIGVNKRLHPVALFELAHGGSADCYFLPKELLTRALMCGANGIIVAHNHPSGNTLPSADDIDICKRIEHASSIIGIDLIDFIIVGDDTYSFREREELTNEI